MSQRSSRFLTVVVKALGDLQQKKGSSIKQILDHISAVNCSKSTSNIVAQTCRALREGVSIGYFKYSNGKYRRAISDKKLKLIDEQIAYAFDQMYDHINAISKEWRRQLEKNKSRLLLGKQKRCAPINKNPKREKPRYLRYVCKSSQKNNKRVKCKENRNRNACKPKYDKNGKWNDNSARKRAKNNNCKKKKPCSTEKKNQTKSASHESFSDKTIKSKHEIKASKRKKKEKNSHKKSKDAWTYTKCTHCGSLYNKNRSQKSKTKKIQSRPSSPDTKKSRISTHIVFTRSKSELNKKPSCCKSNKKKTKKHQTGVKDSKEEETANDMNNNDDRIETVEQQILRHLDSIRPNSKNKILKKNMPKTPPNLENESDNE